MSLDYLDDDSDYDLFGDGDDGGGFGGGDGVDDIEPLDLFLDDGKPSGQGGTSALTGFEAFNSPNTAKAAGGGFNDNDDDDDGPSLIQQMLMDAEKKVKQKNDEKQALIEAEQRRVAKEFDSNVVLADGSSAPSATAFVTTTITSRSALSPEVKSKGGLVDQISVAAVGKNYMEEMSRNDEELKRLAEQVKKRTAELEYENKVPPIDRLHQAFFQWLEHSKNILLLVCMVVDKCNPKQQQSSDGMNEEELSSSFNATSGASNKRPYSVTGSSPDPNAKWTQLLPVAHDTNILVPTQISSALLENRIQQIEEIQQYAVSAAGLDAISHFTRVQFGNFKFDSDQQRPWKPGAEAFIVPNAKIEKPKDTPKLSVASPTVIPSVLGDSVLDFENQLLSCYVEGDADELPTSIIEQILCRGTTAVAFANLIRRFYVLDAPASDNNNNGLLDLNGTMGGTLGRGGTMSIGGGGAGANAGPNASIAAGGGSAAKALLTETLLTGASNVCGFSPACRLLLDCLGTIAAQALDLLYHCVTTAEIPLKLYLPPADTQNQRRARPGSAPKLSAAKSFRLNTEDRKTLGGESLRRTKCPDLALVYAATSEQRDRYDDADDVEDGDADDEGDGDDPEYQLKKKILKFFSENGQVVGIHFDHRLFEPLFRGVAGEALSAASVNAMKCLIALDQKRLASEWICYTMFMRSEEFTCASVKAAAMTVAEASIFGELVDMSISEDEDNLRGISWLRPSLSLLVSLVDRCNNHISASARRRRKNNRAGGGSAEQYTNTNNNNNVPFQSTTNFPSTQNLDSTATLNSQQQMIELMNTSHIAGGNASFAGGGRTLLIASHAAVGASTTTFTSAAQQHNQIEQLLEQTPQDRETIEFVMDAVNFALAQEGVLAFLRSSGSTYNIVNGNTPTGGLSGIAATLANLGGGGGISNAGASVKSTTSSGGPVPPSYFNFFYNGGTVSCLKILQRLVHMLARMHRHYCSTNTTNATGGGASSPFSPNSLNVSHYENGNHHDRDNVPRSPSSGKAMNGENVSNNNSPANGNNNNNRSQHQPKEPCKCHTLVTRIVKLLNPLTMMNHLRKSDKERIIQRMDEEERIIAERKRQQQQKFGSSPNVKSPIASNSPTSTGGHRNNVAFIEKIMSPAEINVILEIVRDTLNMFVITPLGPTLATLRAVSQFAAPSERWCFDSLSVNPFAPTMVALQMIATVKELVLEDVGIIYVFSSLSSLKSRENPQRMIQPLIGSGAMRALATCFSMFFSVIEPLLFRHRIHLHHMNPATAGLAGRDRARSRSSSQAQVYSSNTEQHSSMHAAAAAAAVAASSTSMSSRHHHHQEDPHEKSSLDIAVPTLGKRHGSIYVSSRPNSAAASRSGHPGGASINTTASSGNEVDELEQTNNGAGGGRDENLTIGDELIEFRTNCFESMGDAVQLVMNMLLPFHNTLGCMADSMSAQPIDLNDPDALTLSSKTPDETLALYVLCDLAGISPVGAGLKALPANADPNPSIEISSSSSNNSNNNNNSSSPNTLASTGSSDNNFETTAKRRQSTAAQQALLAAMDEAVNTAAVTEGAGISTCAAILAFLRFQAIIGVAHYHYCTKHHEMDTLHNGGAENPAFAASSINVADIQNPSEHDQTAADAEALKSLRKRVTWLFALISRLSQVPGTEVKLRLVKAGLLETLCVCTDPSSSLVIEHPHAAMPWSDGSGLISSRMLRHVLSTTINQTDPTFQNFLRNELQTTVEDCAILIDYHSRGDKELNTASTHEYLRAHAAFGSEAGFYHASCDNAQPALKMLTQHLIQLGALSHHQNGDAMMHLHRNQFHDGSGSNVQDLDLDNNNPSFSTTGGGVNGNSGGSPLKLTSVSSNSSKFAVFDAGINTPVVYTLMCTSMMMRSFKYYFTKAHLSSAGWLAEASSGTLSACERNVAILTSILANSLRRTATSASTPITRRLGVVQCVRELARKLTGLAEQTKGEDSVDEDEVVITDDTGDNNNNNHPLIEVQGTSTTTVGPLGNASFSQNPYSENNQTQVFGSPRSIASTTNFPRNASPLQLRPPEEDPEIQAAALLQRAEKRVQQILRKHGILSPKGFALDTLAGGALLSSLATHAASAVEAVQHHINVVNEYQAAKENASLGASSASASLSPNPNQTQGGGGVLGRRRSSMLGSRRGSLLVSGGGQSSAFGGGALGAGGGLAGAVQIAAASSTHQYQYATSAFAAIASFLRLPFQSVVLLKTSTHAVEHLRFPPFFPVWFHSSNTWGTRVAIEDQHVLDDVMMLSQNLSIPCQRNLQAQRDKANGIIPPTPETNSNNNNLTATPSASDAHKQRNRPNSAVSFRINNNNNNSNSNAPEESSIAPPMINLTEDVDSKNNTINHTKLLAEIARGDEEEKEKEKAAEAEAEAEKLRQARVSTTSLNPEASSVVPPMLRRRQSGWGLVAAAMIPEQDNNNKPSKDNKSKDLFGGVTISPQALEKISISQLMTQQSCGFLICVLSAMIEAPQNAIRLARMGSNKEYYDDIRLTIASDESAMFAVQQAAKGYRDEQNSNNSAGRGGIAAAARGRRGSFRSDKDGKSSDGKDNLQHHHHSGSGAGKNEGMMLLAANLTRAEMRLCIEQYTLLLTRRQQKLRMEQELNEMEINSRFNIIDRNSQGNNNNNKSRADGGMMLSDEAKQQQFAAATAQFQQFFTQFMLDNKKDTLFNQETAGRNSINQSEENSRFLLYYHFRDSGEGGSDSGVGEFVAFANGDKSGHDEDDNGFYSNPMAIAKIMSQSRRKSMARPMSPPPQSSTLPQKVEATLALRDAISSLVDAEYAMRSSITVAETSSFDSIESKEERARDRIYFHATLASLPQSVITNALQQNNGFSRRLGLVTESEEDAEFTRVLKEKRETERAVLRIKEAQESLFNRLRETVEKEQNFARTEISEAERVEFYHSILPAERKNKQDILYRQVEVRLAALELLEKNDRYDVIIPLFEQERTQLKAEFDAGFGEKEKPVYVHYSWGPPLFSNNNYMNGMMRIPTPPLTTSLGAGRSIGGGGGRPTSSRPTSAMSNRSTSTSQIHINNNHHPQQQQNDFFFGTRPSTTPHQTTVSSLINDPNINNQQQQQQQHYLSQSTGLPPLAHHHHQHNRQHHHQQREISPHSRENKILTSDLEAVSDFLNGEVSRSLLDQDFTRRSLRVLPASYAPNSKTVSVINHDDNNNNNNTSNLILSHPPKALLVMDLSKHFLGDNGASQLAETLQQHYCNNNNSSTGTNSPTTAINTSSSSSSSKAVQQQQQTAPTAALQQQNCLAARVVALDVSNNGLTDNGASFILDALRGSTALFELNMSGNKKISSKSGKMFVKFVTETPNLRKLNLDGTQIFKSTLFVIKELLESRTTLAAATGGDTTKPSSSSTPNVADVETASSSNNIEPNVNSGGQEQHTEM